MLNQDSQPTLLRGISSSENQVVIDVLKDIIQNLMQDPGGYDDVEKRLGEHFQNFVTKKETLEEIVNILIEQAITEPRFRYVSGKLLNYLDSSKCLELEDGCNFRDQFYKRCQKEFRKTKSLLGDTDSRKLNENLLRIANTAMLFGELLCSMKVKGCINNVFKNVICEYVDMFLASQSTELIKCLTKLLKLVGPDLDVGRPKDIEAMFDKVKDFYLDEKNSWFLSRELQELLKHVYKFHSIDWHREDAVMPSYHEFGRKPVTPLMMDFIANAMNDRDLNDIINKTLPPNIAQDEKTIYDKSYAVLRALITKQIVTNCSEMKELLEKTNEILAKMFKDEFDVPRRGCEDQDTSQILTNQDFLFLSNNIGKNWKRFARHVNVGDNEIDEIEVDTVRNQDKCLKVFKELERKQKSVNWTFIKKALQEIELHQLIAEFKPQQNNLQI